MLTQIEIFGSLILAVVTGLPGTARDGEWKAGAAKVVITPDELMWMSGYASRDKPAEGALHNLWAKALVIEDPAGNRALLISLDLLGVTKPLSDRVCARLGDKLGLPRRAIMIATSHTHCGPVIEGNLTAAFDLSAAESAKVTAYTRSLEEKMVQVAETALERLAPARLAWGTGTATFAVNRRNNKEADVPELRAAGQLEGPVDHDVPVLRVAAPDAALRAVVFGYACHNTTLGFYQWCGDYAGFAQIELEKAHPDAVALFFAGCGGDQNPLPRRTVELAEQYGRELAGAVSETLRGDMRPIAGPLTSGFELLALPFDTLPTDEAIAQQAQSSNKYEQRRAKLLQEQIGRDGKLSSTYPYPVQVWQFGQDLTWVALGGEVVVDYSLRLKRELGPGRTWVAGYANDVMAYIPSRRVLEEGGYEGGGAMVYYGLPSRWAPEVEELIVRKAHDLAGHVRREQHDR